MTDRETLLKIKELVADVAVEAAPTITYGHLVDSVTAATQFLKPIPTDMGFNPHYWIEGQKWVTDEEAKNFRAPVANPIEAPQAGIDDTRRVLPSDGSFLVFGAAYVGEERTYTFTCERNTQVFTFGPVSGGVGHWEGVTVTVSDPSIGTFTNTEATVGYGIFQPGRIYYVTVKMVNGGACSVQVQG